MDIKDAKRINLLLNEEKWEEAIPKLLILMQQCDTNLLLSEGSRWFKLCSQIFSKNVHQVVIEAAALALKYILQTCRKHSKLQVEISKLSSVFLSDLCKDRASIPIPVFELIYDYLLQFSSQAMPYRGSIEKATIHYLISKNINNEDHSTMVAAARVYSILPCSGAYMSENRICSKSDQLMQFVFLAHQAMNILFNVVVELESYDLEQTCKLKISGKNIVAKGKDLLESYKSAVTIFRNSLTYVQEFITHTDSDLKINPKLITSIFMRPLEVHAIEKRNDLEYTILRCFLPDIHQASLIAMKNMLLVKNEGVDRYYEDMLKCLEYLLNSDKESLPLHSKTKELAYDALCALSIVNTGGLFLPMSFCNFIIRDITPKKKSVIFNKNAKLSKKKGNLQNEAPIESQIAYYGNVVIAALKFVTDIYVCNFVNISNLFAQKLNTCLMTLLLNLNEGPYVHSIVRRVFYDTFKFSMYAPRESVPISYSRRVNLLNYRKRLETTENARIIEEIILLVSCKYNIGEHNSHPSGENNTAVNGGATEGTDEIEVDDDVISENDSPLSFKVESDDNSDIECVSGSQGNANIEGQSSEDKVEHPSAEEQSPISEEDEMDSEIKSDEDLSSDMEEVTEIEDSEPTEDHSSDIEEVAKVVESDEQIPPVSEDVAKMIGLFVPKFK